MMPSLLAAIAYFFDGVVVFALLGLAIKAAFSGEYQLSCLYFGAHSLYSIEIRHGRALESIAKSLKERR